MPELPGGHIAGPSNWRGDRFDDDTSWIDVLSPEIITNIDAALMLAKERGLQPPAFGKADFPLPAFAEQADRLRKELEGGRGFALLRGLTMDRYSASDTGIIFWGIACHTGQVVSQNAYGELVGHVRDHGLNINNPNVRSYQTTQSQDFHNDLADVIGLMCVRQARRAGESSLVSAATIHDIMLAERPDLLPALFEPFTVDRRGEPGRPGEESDLYYRLPVFSYHRGLLTAHLKIMDYYKSAERHPGVSRMTQAQQDALTLLWEIAHRPGVAVEFLMQPGDLQFACNYSVLHARSTFEDWDEPERKRHLLRIWLCIANSRELPATFKPLYQSVAPGTVRGWIPQTKDQTLEPA